MKRLGGVEFVSVFGSNHVRVEILLWNPASAIKQG